MDVLLRCLRLEEGFRAKPYKCTRGHWTIGYGHNLDANPLTVNDLDAMGAAPGVPLELSTTQAAVLLVRDINRLVIPAAHRIFRPDCWTVYGPVRRAALGSMIFQMGEGGVRGFVDMLRALRRNDWPGAADAAADSEWHNDPVKGTPERAERHVKALRTGKDQWK